MSADRISYEQVRALTDTMDRTMARLVEQTCHDINNAERKIEAGLSFLEDTAARVRRALADGSRMNSLGEFQRTPVEVDMAIAARQAGFEQLGRMIGDEAANKLAAQAA